MEAASLWEQKYCSEESNSGAQGQICFDRLSVACSVSHKGGAWEVMRWGISRMAK